MQPRALIRRSTLQHDPCLAEQSLESGIGALATIHRDDLDSSHSHIGRLLGWDGAVAVPHQSTTSDPA